MVVSGMLSVIKDVDCLGGFSGDCDNADWG